MAKPSRLKQISEWPGWIFGLIREDKNFSANPVLGSRHLNGIGLHAARLLFAHFMTRMRRAVLSVLMPSPLRKRFRADGFVVLPDFLSGPELAAIIAEIRSLEAPVRQMEQSDTLTQRILLDSAALSGAPALRGLVRSRRFTHPIAYAGAKWVQPLVYVQRIRNGAVESGLNRPDPQKTIHSDTFHPTVKAWLFLEDVTEEKGPFSYSRGSHRLTAGRLRWEYGRSLHASELDDGYSEKGSLRATPEDLESMAFPPLAAVTVKAGTLVIADTHGFHARGQAQPGQSRLELWAYSRFNPFSPWPGLGLGFRTRLAERLLQKRWRKADEAAQQTGGRSTWHLIGKAEMLDGV